MRNPGYMNGEGGMVWEHACDVLFNGVDFGPNLVYGSFSFTPPKLRKNQTKIAGMPGVYDYSTAPGGYPVPDAITGTLEMHVLDPQAWGTPCGDFYPDQLFISPEAYFLSIINAGKTRLDFINSNEFYLIADIEITKYTRFNLGFTITMKLEAEPYWWEGTPHAVEWMFSAPAFNLFSEDNVTVTTEGDITIEWTTAPFDENVGLYLIHGTNGSYADIVIPDLDPERTYSFGCRNIYSHGVWQLFDDQGQLMTKITGTTYVTLRLISRSAKLQAVGFRDICLYDVTDQGVVHHAIETLDAPLKSLYTWCSSPVRMVLDGKTYWIPAGEQTIHGLNIPPRSSVPVTILSDTNGYGYLSYRRGAVSCTL